MTASTLTAVVRSSSLSRNGAWYYRNTMPTITFKVSPGEAARIRRLALREGRTVSEFLRRRATLRDTTQQETEAYRVETSPVTGLPVLRAPAGVAVATSDQIREIAADFP